MKKVAKIAVVALLMTSCQIFGMQPYIAYPELPDYFYASFDLENQIEKEWGGSSLPDLTDENILKMSVQKLDFLVQNSRKAKEKACECLESCPTSFSDISLAYLCAGNSDKVVDFLIKKIRYSKPGTSFIKGSPTAGHFGRFFENNYNDSYFDMLQKWNLRPCLLKAVLAQKRETKNGRFGYFHAQKSSLFLPEFVYAYLLEWYYRKPINKETFWALRFEKPGQRLPFLEGKKIVQDGPEASDGEDEISYKHFMNCPLFGNMMSWRGSDTLGWFLINANVDVHYIRDSIQDLFAMFGQGKYYRKYKKDFDIIQDVIYKKDVRFGTLLMHVFDEKALNQFVYVAQPGGLKKNDLKIQGKTTTDVKKIYTAMSQNPEQFDRVDQLDGHEYVFVQTEDHPTDKDKLGSLNPFHKGIKTYHFTVQDMSDVKKMVADIFVKIKQDREKDEMKNLSHGCVLQ